MNIADFEAYRAAVSPEESRRLLTKLLRDNTPLIRQLIKKYMPPSDMSADDAFQMGCMGFLRALKTLDPKKGKLSTYLAWWIRHFLQDQNKLDLPISKPQRSANNTKVRRLALAFEARNGRFPEPEEIGVTRAQLDSWRLSEVPLLFDDIDAPGGKWEIEATPEYRGNGRVKLEEILIADQRNPEEELEHKEDLGFVKAAWGRLPDWAKETLRKYVIEGQVPRKQHEKDALASALEEIREAYEDEEDGCK